MKIGVFDPYLDDLGGGEKYCMTIAECLSSVHDVHVFWDREKDFQTIKERFQLPLTKVKRVNNIFSSATPFLKRLVLSREYDAIFFLSDGSIPFSLSKKLFIHVQQPIKNVPKNSLKFRLKARNINKFFCNSAFTKSFADRQFGVNSTVIYPPVLLHPKDTKKENWILHVGRFRTKNVKMVDYKKQAVMISVFKQMVDKGLKGWKFILAVSVKEDEQEEFDRMRKSTQNYPIEFLVNKNNTQLWDSYSKAKIYWHASGYGENLEEHPESMGAGAVPVVINAGGQKEIVSDGESGFLWNTLEELMSRTKELIDNEGLLLKLSKATKSRAQYFAGDRFCDEIKVLLSHE